MSSYIERSLRYCEPIEPSDEYAKLLNDGEKKERARAVLPLGTTTVFLWRLNLREMIHVFEERLTRLAQKETREVVWKMFDLAKPMYPTVLSTFENERELYREEGE